VALHTLVKWLVGYGLVMVVTEKDPEL